MHLALSFGNLILPKLYNPMDITLFVQIICLPRCTLENCTVSLYASSSGLPETINGISIYAYSRYGNVINSTINIFYDR